MWQRSEAFEVMCTYPAREEIKGYSYSDPDESSSELPS
jgi:hypothetical protein